MPLTRRNFLIRGSLSLAAGALSSVLVEAKTKQNTPADFKDWESVRREFELAPDHIQCTTCFEPFDLLFIIGMVHRDRIDIRIVPEERR